MSQQRMSRLASGGLRTGILSLVVLILCILGSRSGALDFYTSLSVLAFAALMGSFAILLSALGLLSAILRGRRGLRTSVVGMVLGVMVAAPVVQSAIVWTKIPDIHDISTDLENPPAFSAMAPLRGPSANALDRKELDDLAERQRQAYPDIKPFEVAEHPGKLFGLALETARALNWNVMVADPGTGYIEATAYSRVMGFKSDVVVRISENGTGSVIDMRAVSRQGKSDFIINASHVRSFFVDLKKRLNTKEQAVTE